MEKISQEIVAETFNTIRTNINFLGLEKEMKVIMVTSSIKNEGKTTICCHIADAFASIKKKALLIDCDMRNPSVGKELGIIKPKGLTDMIMAERGEGKDYRDYMYNVNDYFDVVTAGFRPPNPSEMVSSKRLELIVSNLRRQYDVIILDTPPVLLVSDAVSLQRLADGILLVVKYGYTTKEALRESKKVFEVAGIRPAACIFNSIPNVKKRNMYYGYYGYMENEADKDIKKKEQSLTVKKAKIFSDGSKNKYVNPYRRKIK